MLCRATMMDDDGDSNGMMQFDDVIFRKNDARHMLLLIYVLLCHRHAGMAAFLAYIHPYIITSTRQ